MASDGPRAKAGNPERGHVLTLLHEAETAWNRRDLHAFGALFATEAGYITRERVMLRGRYEIEQAHKAALAGPLRGTRLKLTAQRIEFLAPQVVVIQARVQLTPAETGARPTDALSTLVLAKGEEGWRIYAGHTSHGAGPETSVRVQD